MGRLRKMTRSALVIFGGDLWNAPIRPRLLGRKGNIFSIAESAEVPGGQRLNEIYSVGQTCARDLFFLSGLGM